MLLQEYEGRIAASGKRLEEQQKDKAAAAEVSAVQVALLPAGTSLSDHGPCHHQEYACIMFDYNYGLLQCIMGWVLLPEPGMLCLAASHLTCLLYRRS